MVHSVAASILAWQDDQLRKQSTIQPPSGIESSKGAGTQDNELTDAPVVSQIETVGKDSVANDSHEDHGVEITLGYRPYQVQSQ